MDAYLLDNTILETAAEEENMETCENCGCVCEADALTKVGNLQLCIDCRDELSLVCDVCGCTELNDEAIMVGEDTICSSCAEETTICACCSERAYDNDITYVDDEPICQHCLDNSDDIGTCDSCGYLHLTQNLRYDDITNEELCCHCYNNREIHNYHSGTPLTFYGTGKYHFGVELEVDGGSVHDRDDSARNVIHTLDGHVYCESDASLDTGFEIITHPHTYEELISLPWEQALTALSGEGWRGHDVTTAGLHVHIGRACFDTDEAITRFCTFFENNWSFVRAFSRRTDSQLESYAARYFDNGGESYTKYSASEVKTQTENNRNRYKAVNLTNYATVEVRVFRSTLKYTTFMASLELVYLLAERCNHITDEEAENMTVSQWLAGASSTLCDYCASKGYPINKSDTLEREAA